MTTISELVEDLSVGMGVHRKTVNSYARVLLDSELLPKSRGRSIAHVDAKHIFRLTVAVALSERIRETPNLIEQYIAMVGSGVPHGAPVSLTHTVEDYFETFYSLLSLNREDISQEDEGLRKSFINGEISINSTWPEIAFTFHESIDSPREVWRFEPIGQGTRTWKGSGYMKRETVLHGRLFLMLGTENGRNYHLQKIGVDGGDR
ncbi:MAG: hypothetical protein ABJL64_20070 [Rhizobiaceae bacterium]